MILIAITVAVFLLFFLPAFILVVVAIVFALYAYCKKFRDVHKRVSNAKASVLSTRVARRSGATSKIIDI
jgi:hypothetical protein